MTTRGPSRHGATAGPDRLRPGLRQALGAISEAPALVLTGRLDVLAVNPLGRALITPVLEAPGPNLARFLFLEPARSTEFYPEWDAVADEQVSRLRAEALRTPHHRALHRLIGELSTGSARFRELWSSSRPCACRPPRVRILHPVVGEIVLHREDVVPAADSTLTLRLGTVEPGTPSEERLRFLASWAAAPSASC
ncbi:hypothetical protein [Brachybacterium saurashtrense]|uniref:MmyB-like transcription regulator ligand binding domain-containing protein n=1 Tax=Brachybacterium saurashtrense TaxID=556288 RepID=A0A345YP42_9MICO|nr:hypothetical protein [Brachybacterium saurashtrense]AXK45694.1 hypothetical protein DWV08_08795 [Brachybacterium saurashtrense]RRR24712.1 hypothetical protein DXU92_00540 [Brachybacterium saurashtrense]